MGAVAAGEAVPREGSVVEEAEVGVDEGDPQLVAGLDHDVVSSRARRGSDELHPTLHRQGRVQGSEDGQPESPSLKELAVPLLHPHPTE